MAWASRPAQAAVFLRSHTRIGHGLLSQLKSAPQLLAVLGIAKLRAFRSSAPQNPVQALKRLVRLLASIRLHFVGPCAFLQEQQARCGQNLHRLLCFLASVSTPCPKTIAVPAARLAMTRRRWLPAANTVVRRSNRCASIWCPPCEFQSMRNVQPVSPRVFDPGTYAGLMFWFTRKRLSGSYVALIWANRAY